MTNLTISLLGRLQIHADGKLVELCKTHKALELLCYIVLLESRKKSRELIASELWPYNLTSQSRSYLRRALWCLRQWLDDVLGSGNDFIRLDRDALYINPDFDVRTDTAILEEVAISYAGVSGSDLSTKAVAHIEKAVATYRGDLLENWYEGWIDNCRDSYKSIQFTLLDKIIDYCVAYRLSEKGLRYCTQVLFLDPAREKSYRARMLLLYDAGRRVDALRQYEQCCRMLSKEFDIKPSPETEMLRQLIVRSGDLQNISFLPGTG